MVGPTLPIAAVLMPLAFGYYAGGRFRGSVRRRIVRNLCIAAAILAVAAAAFFIARKRRDKASGA